MNFAIMNQEINFNKAVIFTHFGDLKYDEEFIANRQPYITKFTRKLRYFLESSLEIDNISIVYIYIDWATKYIVNSINDNNYFSIDPKMLAQEVELIDVLKVSERIARQELNIDRIKFHYIGINELVQLVNSIVEVDRSLLSLLSGKDGTFSYDSPKFIESVIRIARARSPHLSIHPVIRVDEDIIINPTALDKIIAEYNSRIRYSNFYFFSGIYGDPKSNTYDPINDHPVRVHWFYPTGDFENINVESSSLTKINFFLSDMSVIGATQIAAQGSNFSTNMKKIIKEKDIKSFRVSTQVTSGAGLVMSGTAISYLPPFMNFSTHVTWIDDYLKRRLHEAIGDINPCDTESLGEATIKQIRHTKGIYQRDHDWAYENYFERILCGAMFKSMIVDYYENPTEYSLIIKDIIKFKITHPEELDNRIEKIASDMLHQLHDKCNDVIFCFQSKEYKDTLLYKWAIEKEKDEKYKEKVCTNLLEDALSYLTLLSCWPIFVRVIESLPILGHTWLYDE